MTCNLEIRLLSSSPRRREILSAAVDGVLIEGTRGAEPEPIEDETPGEYVLRSAAAKLGPAPAEPRPGFLISADTVVALEDRILGKPRSHDEARAMLEALRDRLHDVRTGVAVLDMSSGEIRAAVESTAVLMRDYSDESVQAYIDRGEPFDKAGGYAVQDALFDPAIRLEGCYLNVVGLPLCLVADLVGPSLKLRPLECIPYYGSCTDCKLRSVGEVEP